MGRLKQIFEHAQAADRKLLSFYLPAGYPDREQSRRLLLRISRSGADFLEIGLPFSDPIADGPTIQAASQQALDNGTTLGSLLEDARHIRQNSDVPLLLMGYFNPILRFGLDTFLSEAEQAGIDGLIVPDLLPEEAERFPLLTTAKLGLNYLIAPNTDTARIKIIDKSTTDFLYCVAVTGVTGARTTVDAGLGTVLTRIREKVTHPLMVGFGVSKPEHASKIAQFSDGAIIGSALIKHIDRNAKNMIDAADRFVRAFRTELDRRGN